MKVFILAGGQGTRMGGLTQTLPKPMIKLANKPVLEHQIEIAKRYAIRDVIVLTGYKGKVIENYFGNGEGAYNHYWQSYWHIIIVLFSGIEDKEPISLLGRVEVSILLLAGICFAGIITGEIVSILVKKIQRTGKVTILPKKSNLEQHIVIIGHYVKEVPYFK